MTGKNFRVRKGSAAARQPRCVPKWIKPVLITVALCLLLLFLVDRGFRPMLEEFALTQAKFLAVTTINSSIDEELKNYPVSYEELVHITRDNSGAITSLEMDPAAMNDISSRLTLAANAALSTMPLQKVSIPVGTVLGWQMLTGRGPLIHFYIQPASYVESSFISTLEGAGINQTQHKVILRMTVVVETFAAGYHISQTVISDMVLAQTVIVGDVPNFFYSPAN